MIRSSPRASVVYSSPSELTIALDRAADGAGLEADPLADAERPGAQQHHAGDQVAERLLRREPEDDGRERASGDQLPRRCTPATQSAISSVIPIVASRIRKPTVPAVAGSIRRKNVGPAARPMSRASAHPSASSAITTTRLDHRVPPVFGSCFPRMSTR